MQQGVVSGRGLRTLNVLALAALLVVGAFHLGKADAARSGDVRRRTSVVEAVEHAAPAVVSIRAMTASRRRTRIYSSGSGVIVHPAGYVITNSHVIRGGRSVTVELFNEEKRYRAQIVANIPNQDLALLRIQRPGGFPYVSIVPTHTVIRGETAIAIGNPHGLGDTITVGVVSALGRDASVSRGVKLYNLIQTDASINTGNSGGALLNLDGELLGVVVSLMPRCTGIAFAIPGDQVKALVQRALGHAPKAKPLPEKKAPAPVPQQSSSQRARPAAPPQAPPPQASRGGLPPPSVGRGKTSGIKTEPMRPEDYGMTWRDTGAFIQVTQVEPSSPAYLAGIRVGDRILDIEGRPVECDLDIVLAFSAARPGKIYQVRVQRGAREMNRSLITPRN